MTVIVICMVCFAALPARAAFPGRNGKLAYASWASIWTSLSDGSRLNQLTKIHRPFGPAWSPRGRQIAFSCPDGRFGDPEICLMRADGSNKRRLTRNAAEDMSVDWAPNGRRLVYTRDGRIIIVMNLRTRRERTILLPFTYVHSPSWSPNGKRIAFSGAAADDSDIYTMDPDGSALVNVTDDDATQDDPDWSPNGRRLVFNSHSSSACCWRIQTIRRDGRRLRTVTPGSMFAVSPSWSPNGLRIVFSGYDDVGRNGALNGYQSIFTIRADGTGVRKVTRRNQDFYSPDWQPLPR